MTQPVSGRPGLKPRVCLTPKALFCLPQITHICALVTLPSRIKTRKQYNLNLPEHSGERQKSAGPPWRLVPCTVVPPLAPCSGLREHGSLCLQVPPRGRNCSGRDEKISHLKADSGRWGEGVRGGETRHPVIRTQAEREAPGLAQTTSTILRSNFETDRLARYLDPFVSGREADFPSSLGKARPQA